MSDLTITHTPIDGTQLGGSSKGDGVNVLLRSCPGPWRWAPSVGAFLIQRSRDQRVPKTWHVEQTAKQLREAGHTVTVDIDTDGPTRSVAEVEQDRADRVAARTERLEERAERKAGEADAAWNAEHEILDRIPLGQPVLVDHYSAPRHRRALARAEGHRRRASDAHDASKRAADGAQAAAATQRHRESGPATMRRLEKLRAEARGYQRSLDGYTTNQGPYSSTYPPATGAHREQLLGQLAENTAQVEHWEAHLAELVESGEYVVWTSADFEKGDLIKHRGTWSEVLRVNKKSLTIPHILAELAVHGRTWTLPFDEVRERVSKADAEAARAKRDADAVVDLAPVT